MGFSILVGLMDGFGLAMFLPLLQMVDKDSTAHPEALGNLEFLVKGLKDLGIPITLSSILILLASFFALKGIALYINSSYEVNLRQSFVKSIRVELTEKLSQISYKSFVLSDAGRIQNTLSGEVARISTAYQNYFLAIQQLILVIVYMIFAFTIDAEFAILITVGGMVTNLLFRKIYKLTKQASSRLTSGTNSYQGLIIQFVSNFKYLKATGTIGKFNRKLLASIKDIEGNNKKIGKLNAIITSTRESILILVVCTVIFIQVNVFGGILGSILVSLLFFYRALSSLVLMQNYYNAFLGVSGSLGNMTEFEHLLQQNREITGRSIFETFKDKLILRKASLLYNERPILKQINLEIQRNEVIAFVGESGSGKTTLVNVLVGLLPLDEGTLLIDGMPSSSIDITSFQKRVGYIAQEPVIFNDTIYNNVTFWAEPTEENKRKFWYAVEKASIDQYIVQLDQGEHAVLGNNGLNLSGGQKQRISIARELFKDIDILVLDEATSALDSETEKNIQENIEQLRGVYTIVMVAHRLSTIKSADKVILLNQGKIESMGSYDDLVRSSPVFKKMIDLQEL